MARAEPTERYVPIRSPSPPPMKRGPLRLYRWLQVLCTLIYARLIGGGWGASLEVALSPLTQTDQFEHLSACTYRYIAPTHISVYSDTVQHPLGLTTHATPTRLCVFTSKRHHGCTCSHSLVRCGCECVSGSETACQSVWQCAVLLHAQCSVVLDCSGLF